MLEAFTFHDKGFVVSVGARRGVADIAGITSGGQLAHLLKDAIEWAAHKSRPQGRGAPGARRWVLHPSVGNQPVAASRTYAAMPSHTHVSEPIMPSR
jgi:hypothetical protein